MRNILVVEDERSLRDNIKEYLVSKDFKVYTASNSREALETCSIHSIDLLILDIYLGNDLGLDVSIKISDDARLYGKPKVIVMSGTLGGELLKSEHFKMENRFDEFIKKPFALDDLLYLIYQVLKLS